MKGARVFGCFIREDNGSISLSEQYTKMYKDWQQARNRNGVVESASAIFGIEEAGAKAIPYTYLEGEGDRVEIFHMWLIDRAAIDK
ncbi:hypothetical protein [Paraburkholderia domus]|uniref:hypothetical protein n=1 Tax=Paraburkholderia domus TaxID=2793075 RepID=UPI001B27B723|nr:hypothetical protein [Paraburkholderia domus]CAE6696509.1 hypothetical protein R75483_00619 [Paraburkholderia domus]